MNSAPIVIDVAALQAAKPAALVDAVLRATLSPAAPPMANYYADRVAALGLDVPSAIAAIAGVVPSARTELGTAGPVPGGDPFDTAAWGAALSASCDPDRLDMIEQAMTAFAASPPSQLSIQPIAPGCVAVTPAERAVAQTYFNPPHSTGWRHSVRPAHEASVRVLAARDAQLGLLLGDGMVFHGSFDTAEREHLPFGLVLCGPRAALPPGQYWLDAIMWLPAAALMLLDISSNRGLRRLAELRLRGEFRITLGFAVGPHDDTVEIRLVNLGRTSIVARIERLAIRQ